MKSSEFGGDDGSIQPDPHPLSSVEQARLDRMLDPADASDTVDEARRRGQQKGGRSSQRTSS